MLAACGGNKTQAARVLGIDRRSLYRRLEEPQAGNGHGEDQPENLNQQRRPGESAHRSTGRPENI